MSAWDDATEDVLSEKARAGFQAAKDARASLPKPRDPGPADPGFAAPGPRDPLLTEEPPFAQVIESFQDLKPISALQVHVDIVEMIERVGWDEAKILTFLGKLKDLLA